MIGGRYDIVGKIGSGGMQDVFLAKDQVLDREVALKSPQPGQATKRFRASALVAARVNHHNVAKTLDYFDEGGKCYIIEEFVPGMNLAEKMRRFEVLDPHLGSKVLHHLAKGVAASHHASVVHRDIKPSNVMVPEGVNFGTIKITDFGIATLTEQIFDEAAQAGDITQSTSGTIRGALPFMAPEMMFCKPGDRTGPPVDIWSLGALMFLLLTGNYPFGVYLEAAVNVKNQQRLPWPNFMTSNPQYAPLATELQLIVDSCLSYDPEKRPSADQIVTKCQSLCYIDFERREGRVNNFIHNGSSAFLDCGSEKVFFNMESVYGPKRPDLGANARVCFSSFPGQPRDRAHPVTVMI